MWDSPSPMPTSLMIAQPTNNLSAKTKVWNIEYDFEYDQDEAGDNFMSHHPFPFSFFYPYTASQIISLFMSLDRRLLSYQYIRTYFAFILHSICSPGHLCHLVAGPVCRRISYAAIKMESNCSAIFSWRYIYSLDMIYCILVNCLLSTHGNDMSIACSVIVWPR
jgi:hypothetical protein